MQAVRATSWASQILSNSVFGIGSSRLSCVSGRRRRRREGRLARSPGFSKWWGRSASKVDAVALAQLVALRRRRRARPRPRSTSAVSRLPGSCIGGSSGAAGGAAGAERVARELGALAGLRRGEHLEAVAAARVAAAPALAGAHDRDGAALVEAQQLREAQLQARRRSAPRRSASGSSRRARPGRASARSRRCARRGRAGEVHRLAQRRGRAARSWMGRFPAVDGRHTPVRYHVHLYPSGL